MRTSLFLSMVGLGLLMTGTAQAQFGYGYVPHTTTHHDVVRHGFHHDIVPHTTTHFDQVPSYRPGGFQANFGFSSGYQGYQTNLGYQNRSFGGSPSYYGGGGHGYVPHTTTHFDAVPHGFHHHYVPHTTTHFDQVPHYGHH